MPRAVVVVAFAAGALALAARWQLPPHVDGGRFEPRHDALEYAAGAQSIAQDGRYLLHVGPRTARPRYAPGFPLLLAGALRLGVAPERLSGVTAAADAGLAIVLALGAGALVVAAARGLGGERRAAERAASVAAALAGLVVALATWHVRHAKLLHSDAPVALAGALALVLWGARFRHGAPRSRAARTALAAAAGCLFGWVATARPIEAALLAPALALAPFALEQRRLATIARAVAVAAAGAALPIVAAGSLLAQSGEPPWAWTAYALWEPQFYDARAHYFDARFAFEPSPALPAGAPRADWPGWRTAVSTLTGVPLADLAPGPVWPTAGWIALAVLLLRLARRPDPVAREVAAWLALLALWSAAHALFFPFYFFPARRFYLVAAHVATLLAAAGAGLLLAARGRGAKAAGALLALGIALPTLAAYRAYVRSPDARPVPVRAELEPRFRAWRALAPEARRATVFPLDPLQAQAFGWLDRATAESIGEWGELPATLHVRRLERLDEKRREPSAPLPGRDRAPRQ